jgi:hypothetical protein
MSSTVIFNKIKKLCGKYIKVKKHFCNVKKYDRKGITTYKNLSVPWVTGKDTEFCDLIFAN